jgi:hypothetical protein
MISHFSLFRDSVCISARQVHGLPEVYHKIRNHFGRYLLGEAQVEARFGPFGGSANLDTRLVHGLRRTCHRLRNHFGRT